MKIDFTKIQYERLEEIQLQKKNMYMRKKYFNGITSLTKLKEEEAKIIAGLKRRGKWNEEIIKK